MPGARLTFLLVSTTLALGAPALMAQRSATVNCSGKRLDLAERDVCASPDLIELAARIDGSTRRLEGQLTGIDRQALIDTEHPFVVARNACQNQSGAVHACDERIMNARADALALAASTPSSIQSEVTKYHYVQVAYVDRWGVRLLNEHLQVWGCLFLDRRFSALTAARITIRSTCEAPSRGALIVHPAALSESDSVFLQAAPRLGYWSGTLERASDKYLLTGWRPNQ